MTEKDFETDRGSGAIITAFAVLAVVALAVLYMLFPVEKDTAGNDTPQAKVGQTAPVTPTEPATTGAVRN